MLTQVQSFFSAATSESIFPFYSQKTNYHPPKETFWQTLILHQAGKITENDQPFTVLSITFIFSGQQEDTKNK